MARSGPHFTQRLRSRRFPVWLRVRLILILSGTLAAAGPSAAEVNRPWVDASRVVHLRAGIVCHPRQTGTEEAPLAMTGSVRLLDLAEISVETQRIPAFDGTEFGVEIQIAPGVDPAATVTLFHPPFGPEGRTSESWDSELDPQSPVYNGFWLRLEDGDPTGIWTFAITMAQGAITETKFELFRPRKDTPDPCGEFLSS